MGGGGRQGCLGVEGWVKLDGVGARRWGVRLRGLFVTGVSELGDRSVRVSMGDRTQPGVWS